MHRSMPFTLASVVLLSVGCGRGRVPEAVHESLSFPASPDKLVRVELGSTDVTVRVDGSERITVDIDMEVRGSSAAAARRWLERHKPEIEDSEKALQIRTPSGRQALYLASFSHARSAVKVTVPASCRLEASTTSGDVELDGALPLTGPVRITTSSGDVRVEGAATSLVIHTASGDCEVNGAPLSSVEFESSSGDLKLRAAAGRLMTDTSSGSVTALQLSGSASASSSSGDFKATWNHLTSGEMISVESTSGDVTLRLPAEARLRGRLESTSGHIRCDFPGTCHRRECLLMTTDSANEVKVSTHSGEIHLRARTADEPEAAPAAPALPKPQADSPQPPEAPPAPDI